MTTILVLISALISSFTVFAEDDELTAQKTACAKNTAMEWSIDLNRCVGKVEARKARHDAQDCNALTDVEARKACHMNLATTKTGVTADPNEAAAKISSGQNQSAVINTASTIISMLNLFASKRAGSPCMSKSILGITSTGGLLTDIWMKIDTKKKLKALQDKYQIDNKTTPYDAQSRALYYLKEEQQVVKKIASLEKKRQMLLMIGYGAAGIMAGFESATNEACWQKDPEKPAKSEGEKGEGETVKEDGKTKPPADGSDGGKPAPPADGSDGGKPTPPADGNDGGKPAPVEKTNDYKKYNTVISEKNGSTAYTRITDSDGKTVAVVHGGQMYEGSGIAQNSKGDWIVKKGAVSSGDFNYKYGITPDGTYVNDVAVTSYGSGTTHVSNTAYGTDRTQKPSVRKGR